MARSVYKRGQSPDLTRRRVRGPAPFSVSRCGWQSTRWRYSARPESPGRRARTIENAGGGAGQLHCQSAGSEQGCARRLEFVPVRGDRHGGRRLAEAGPERQRLPQRAPSAPGRTRTLEQAAVEVKLHEPGADCPARCASPWSGSACPRSRGPLRASSGCRAPALRCVEAGRDVVFERRRAFSCHRQRSFRGTVKKTGHALDIPRRGYNRMLGERCQANEEENRTWRSPRK